MAGHEQVLSYGLLRLANISVRILPQKVAYHFVGYCATVIGIARIQEVDW